MEVRGSRPDDIICNCLPIALLDSRSDGMAVMMLQLSVEGAARAALARIDGAEACHEVHGGMVSQLLLELAGVMLLGMGMPVMLHRDPRHGMGTAVRAVGALGILARAASSSLSPALPIRDAGCLHATKTCWHVHMGVFAHKGMGLGGPRGGGGGGWRVPDACAIQYMHD